LSKAITITDDARDSLIASADGDGRKLLNNVEIVLRSAELKQQSIIDAELLKDSLGDALRRFDKGGDHFYSYLYTAFLIRQYQAHWEREGFDLSLRPEIVGTLFNLGFEKSKPSKNPKVGGSSFKVGDKEYTFGGLCFEFYYSGEMMKDFPITSVPFTPVAVLEKQNKAHLKKVEEAMHHIDTLGTAGAETAL